MREKAGDPAFAPWLARWRLTADGEAIVSHSGRLLPVRTTAGEPAILKISCELEERRGAGLMAWWAGEGAARVLALDGDALLLERATGPRSLTAMAKAGEDDEATRALCQAAARLHAPRGAPPAGLVPLDRWFADLFPAAERHGGVLRACAAAAEEMLSAPQDVVVLHGDLHHGNVLDFGARGWLAIDPKGLIGERGFDFANLCLNPDRETALTLGRLASRVAIISHCAEIEPEQLRRWILAWAGLSAIWMAEDGDAANPELSAAEAAASLLDG